MKRKKTGYDDKRELEKEFWSPAGDQPCVILIWDSDFADLIKIA